MAKLIPVQLWPAPVDDDDAEELPGSSKSPRSRTATEGAGLVAIRFKGW